MLMPAAVLVLVMLGAIAVDFAAVFLAQRQLVDTVSAASNDAAGAALSDAAFYGSGQLAVDPTHAASVVCTAIVAQLDGHLHLVSVDLAVETRRVHVRATATVTHVIARAIPGVAHQARVRAESSAIALRTGEAVSDPAATLVWVHLSC
jgi:hypothetical protein